MLGSMPNRHFALQAPTLSERVQWLWLQLQVQKFEILSHSVVGVHHIYHKTCKNIITDG